MFGGQIDDNTVVQPAISGRPCGNMWAVPFTASLHETKCCVSSGDPVVRMDEEGRRDIGLAPSALNPTVTIFMRIRGF